MEENEKLDRNYETHLLLIETIQALHSEPSPETIKAIKELNEQMEKVAIILQQLVNILKPNDFRKTA